MEPVGDEIVSHFALFLVSFFLSFFFFVRVVQYPKCSRRYSLETRFNFRVDSCLRQPRRQTIRALSLAISLRRRIGLYSRAYNPTFTILNTRFRLGIHAACHDVVRKYPVRLSGFEPTVQLFLTTPITLIWWLRISLILSFQWMLRSAVSVFY